MARREDLSTLHSAVVSFYDELFENEIHKELTGSSGFSNQGYWEPATRSVVRASEQLVDKLLEGVPKRGSLLDVACGSGGTTARLATLYDQVTAINISAYQIAQTRARVPSCRALQMDATRLSFKDASFDVVVCVEAAFHFSSKARFFAEAHRVLKPGGWLVLSDVVFAAPRESYALRQMSQLPPTIFPHGNEWNMFTYRDFLEVLGFRASFTSAYRETWQGWVAFARTTAEARLITDPARADAYRQGLANLATFDAAICDYLLVAAQRV